MKLCCIVASNSAQTKVQIQKSEKSSVREIEDKQNKRDVKGVYATKRSRLTLKTA